MSKKGATKIIKTTGFVVGSTIAVAGLGLCGYAIADGAIKLPFNATEIVTPIPPQSVSTSITDTAITVELIENAEYSLDGKVWQDSNIFFGLQPAQEYTVYIRIKATADTPASEPTQVNVTTDKSTQQVPQVTTPESTADSIIFEHIVGVEYSINNGDTWQDENIFSNLSPAQEYTILVRYAETDTQYASEPFTVQISTLKDTQDAPNITEAETTSPNSITMPIMQNAEFSLNNETWQDSNVFNDLTPGQTYTVYIRYKETATQYASPVTTIEVTLDKLTQDAPQVTQAEIVTADSITLPIIAGAEYSINNGVDWQTENIFSELEPKTEYTIYVRLAETATQYASAITQVVVTTDSTAGLYDTDTGQRTMSWQELIDENLIRVDSSGTNLVSASNLTGHLIMDDDITRINSNAFSSNTLTAITISNNVESIPTNCFSWCRNLNTVTLPNGLGIINANAFANCSSLKNINFPDSLISIGSSAFTSCSSLENINLENSNANIDNSAFSGCSNLQTVVLPNNISILNSQTFSNCTSLVNIILPKTLLSIKSSCFGGCSSLTNITIPNSVTSIESGVFSNCSSLETISLSNNLTNIPDNCFSSCFNLQSINLPDNITLIGMMAFTSSGLTSINLPINLQEIGNSAFTGTSITSVIIPENVEVIDNTAFNCDTFQEFIVEENNSYFSADNGVLYNKNKTILLKYPYGKTNSTFVVPEGVIRVENGAFNPPISLMSITLPTTIESLGYYAFSTSLGYLTILSDTPPSLERNLSGVMNLRSIKVKAGTLDLYLADEFWSSYEDKISELTE